MQFAIDERLTVHRVPAALLKRSEKIDDRGSRHIHIAGHIDRPR